MLSVGEILRKQREKKGFTLKQVEKDIRIREKFLADIENNNWNNFSSKVYITGVIKNYSRYLNLDTEKMVAFFRRDYERVEDDQFRRGIASQYLSPETKKVAIFGIVFVCLVFALYFGYQLRLFLLPPAVTIISPVEKTFRSIEQIRITGKTEKDASVTIFGERVYQDKEGIFRYDFPLKKGKNRIDIEVTGANGKKSTLQKEFVLE